jgi:hypothetical protein
LSLKLYRSKLSASEKLLKEKPDKKMNDEIPGRHHKRRPLSKLSFDEIREIIILTVVEQNKYEDVAR